MIVAWTRVVVIQGLSIRLFRTIRLWIYFEAKVESIVCWLYLVMKRRENSLCLQCFDLSNWKETELPFMEMCNPYRKKYRGEQGLSIKYVRLKVSFSYVTGYVK